MKPNPATPQPKARTAPDKDGKGVALPRLFRRRKCAAIIAPIPGTDGMKWLCIAVDGNLQWKTSCECDSREDAEAWVKKTRKHWRKFSDMEVCHRLAPNSDYTTPVCISKYT